MTKIRSRSSSRVRDVRGQSGGGGGLGGLGDILSGSSGGGLGIPGGRGGGFPGGLGGLLKGGGGLMGLLVLAAMFFLPKLLGGSGAVSPAAGNPPAEAPAGSSEGEVACDSDIEAIVCGAVDDVSEYWIEHLPLSFDRDYVEADTVFYSGGVNTACGQASAQMGPFYCPGDSLVYFDLEFLQQLQSQFDATGDLAAQYIVAHEYGHHVQNVLGINAQMRQAQQQDPDRANQYSIALELQADCFAGAWAKDANERQQLEQGEVQEALDAAAAVGDDAIQQQTQGSVDPESWTHGSSAQRVDWFSRGFQTGDPAQCTTFSEVL